MTMNSAVIRKVVSAAIVGVFCSAVTALPAFAQNSDAPQVTVSYSDLNVSTTHGASTLYGRIETAATQLCSPYERSDIMSRAKLNACVDKIVSNTVADLDKPVLNAVYLSKTGSKPVRIQVASR